MATRGAVLTAPRPVSVSSIRTTPKAVSVGGPERGGGIGPSPSWAALRTRPPVSEWGSKVNVHQVRSTFASRLDSVKLNTDSSPGLDKSLFSIPAFQPEAGRSIATEGPKTIDGPRTVFSSPTKREMAREVHKRGRKIVKERAADSGIPKGRMDSSRPDNVRLAPEIRFAPAVNSFRRAQKARAQHSGIEVSGLRQEVKRLLQEQQTQVGAQKPVESALPTAANTRPATSLQERMVVPAHRQQPENHPAQKPQPHESASWKKMSEAKQAKVDDIKGTADADIKDPSPQGIVEIFTYNPATGKHDYHFFIGGSAFYAIWVEHFMTPIKEKKAKTGKAIQSVVGRMNSLIGVNMIDAKVIERKKKKTIWDVEVLPGQVLQPDTGTAQPSLEPALQRMISTELGTKVKLSVIPAVSGKPESALSTKNAVKTDTATSAEANPQTKASPIAYIGNIDRAPTGEKNTLFIMIRHAILRDKPDDDLGAPIKILFKQDKDVMRSRMRELAEAVNTVFPMWDPYFMLPVRAVGEALAIIGQKSTLLYQMGLAMLPDFADWRWRGEMRKDETLVTKGVALLIGWARISEHPAAIIKNHGEDISRRKVDDIFRHEKNELGQAA